MREINALRCRRMYSPCRARRAGSEQGPHHTISWPCPEWDLSVLAAGAGPGCRVGLTRSLSASGGGSSQSCRNVARAGIDVLSSKGANCMLAVHRDLSVIGVDAHKHTDTAAVGATAAVWSI
jgi:hypothetical protein